jgi:hypothetical protein
MAIDMATKAGPAMMARADRARLVSRAVHRFPESKNGVKLALNHNVRSQPRFQGNKTRSSAQHWPELAEELYNVIFQLLHDRRAGSPAPLHCCIGIDADCTELLVACCTAEGDISSDPNDAISIALPDLVRSAQPWPGTEDRPQPPDQTIDHAICELGQNLIEWRKDPESFELVEHRPVLLFVAWGSARAEPVELWRYGIDGLI